MTDDRYCYLELVNTLKGIVSDKKAESLYKEISEKAEAALARGIYPDRATTYSKVMEEKIKEIEQDRIRTEVKTQVNIQAINTKLEQFNAVTKPSQQVNGIHYGIESNLPNGRQSVDAAVSRGRYTYQALLKSYQDEEGAEIERYIADKRNENAILQEYDNIRNKKPVQDVRARRALNSWLKLSDTFLKDANEQHLMLDPAENRLVSQRHNIDNMKSATGSFLGDMKLKEQLFLKHGLDIEKRSAEYNEAAYQRWLKSFKKCFANNETLKYVHPDKEDEFYRSFYNATVNKVHKIYDPDSTSIVPKTKTYSLGESIAAKRLAIPNNMMDWGEYNRVYGDGTLRGAITKEAANMGNDLAIIKELGVSPRAVSNRINEIIQLTGENRQDPQLNRSIKHAKWFMDDLLGRGDNDSLTMSARILRTNIKWQYQTKTGSIFISELSDMGIQANHLRGFGVKSLEVPLRMIRNLIVGLPKGEGKQVLLDIGAYCRGNLGSLSVDWAAIDSPVGFWYKVARLGEQLGLINRWDSGGKASAGYFITRQLSRMFKTSYQGLDKTFGTEFRRRLMVAGIDENFFNLLKENKNSALIWEKEAHVTPSMIDEISNESLRKFYPDTKNLTALRTRLKDTLGTFIDDQIHYSKILPTIGDRALSGMGIDKKTIAGQAWNALFMFKNFHVASFRRIAKPMIYSGGAQTWAQGIFKGNAISSYLKYVANVLPYGLLSYAAYEAKEGRNFPSLDSAETWINAAVRSNAAFLMGSMFSEIYNSDRNVLDGLAGPAVNTIAETGELLKDLGTATFSSDYTKSKDAMQSAKKMMFWLTEGNLPLIHTWYMKEIIRHMITNDIYSHIDPMYGMRRVQKDYQQGKSYWWSPTDNAGIF